MAGIASALQNTSPFSYETETELMVFSVKMDDEFCAFLLVLEKITLLGLWCFLALRGEASLRSGGGGAGFSRKQLKISFQLSLLSTTKKRKKKNPCSEVKTANRIWNVRRTPCTVMVRAPNSQERPNRNTTPATPIVRRITVLHLRDSFLRFISL